MLIESAVPPTELKTTGLSAKDASSDYLSSQPRYLLRSHRVCVAPRKTFPARSVPTIETGRKCGLAHRETVYRLPPTVTICWASVVLMSALELSEKAALSRRSPSRQTSTMVLRQIEKDEGGRRSPFAGSSDTQEFGVDQRRLPKHPGSNDAHPILVYCTTCCSPTILFHGSHTDDAALNPPSASPPYNIQLLIYSALWSRRCSEWGRN